MKTRKILFVFFCFAVLIFSGCESFAKYQELAREHEFAYFFPNAEQLLLFDTQDEAYDWVMTAQAKFASSIGGKPLAKGVPGKLSGPEVVSDKPVTVCCFLTASSQSAMLDLDVDAAAMEKTLKDALSATIVFLVFYEDRGISLASYYLQNGWVFSSSSQHSYFMLNDVRYTPEYPALWGTDKAFQYVWEG